MKTLSILLIAVVLSPTSALSQEKPKLPSRAEVLKGIEDFAKSPLSVEAKAAALMIVTFSDQSDDVTVVISPNVVPWIHSAEPPKFSETLLAAYVVGNVRSQLERQRNANDSYAGVQQVLKTYAQLKEADKTLDIPEIQKFVELEAKKHLRKHVDEALKKLPSRAQLLKGIDDFAKSPLSVKGQAAAAMIVTFADKSDDVTVVILPSFVPWIHSAKPPKFSETLFAAYIVGNVKSQLERQRNANDSYAGVQQVLKTYAQLKEADKTLDIPEIQRFVELEAKKQLRKYVHEALKKDKNEPANDAA